MATDSQYDDERKLFERLAAEGSAPGSFTVDDDQRVANSMFDVDSNHDRPRFSASETVLYEEVVTSELSRANKDFL